jgi:tetratricopeptide (TPR) repeat protein
MAMSAIFLPVLNGQIFPGRGEKTTSDSLKIKHFIEKGEAFLKTNPKQLKIVSLYIDSALKTSQHKFGNIPSELFFLIGRYNFETGDFSGVEDNLIKAEAKAFQENNRKLQADILLFKGRYFLRTGFFRESRDAYEKSIDIAREAKIEKVIPYGNEGIANVMLAAGDTTGYRNFLEEMILSSFNESDTLHAQSGLLRLGNSYVEGDRDNYKADSILRKCLQLSVISKNSYYSGFSCANLGWNFYLDRNYDSARFYYEKSLKYSIPGKHDGITANSLGNIGTIFRDKGIIQKAKSYYSKSLEYAHNLNDWYTLSWVHNDLNKLYLSVGDTSLAYRNYVLYKQYSDSLLSRRSNQGLADARIRYEADNHKKAIALLSERLKNNRIMNIAYTVFLVLVVFIGLLVINALRLNSQRKISGMNEKIAEIRQANLRQQMNPHFIFNTLNSIQYFMYQNDKLATNLYLTKFSNLIRKVLDNSQHTSISLSDEIDALKLYLELESMRFKDKFGFRIIIDEEIDPVLYKIPTMLIQPYVENSICHGLIPLGKKGELEIEISHKGDHLLCRIEDNGIGRDAGIENKRLRGVNHNSLGTQITASRLELVNSIHGTDLKTVFTDLKDGLGKASGTRVEIQIPIIT